VTPSPSTQYVPVVISPVCDYGGQGDVTIYLPDSYQLNDVVSYNPGSGTYCFKITDLNGDPLNSDGIYYNLTNFGQCSSNGCQTCINDLSTEDCSGTYYTGCTTGQAYLFSFTTGSDTFNAGDVVYSMDMYLYGDVCATKIIGTLPSPISISDPTLSLESNGCGDANCIPPSPSPTATPTMTPTPSLTPTLTPTPTVTPSSTPWSCDYVVIDSVNIVHDDENEFSNPEITINLSGDEIVGDYDVVSISAYTGSTVYVTGLTEGVDYEVVSSNNGVVITITDESIQYIYTETSVLSYQV
jgi:hypothetical protein